MGEGTSIDRDEGRPAVPVRAIRFEAPTVIETHAHGSGRTDHEHRTRQIRGGGMTDFRGLTIRGPGAAAADTGTGSMRPGTVEGCGVEGRRESLSAGVEAESGRRSRAAAGKHHDASEGQGYIFHNFVILQELCLVTYGSASSPLSQFALPGSDTSPRGSLARDLRPGVDSMENPSKKLEPAAAV